MEAQQMKGVWVTMVTPFDKDYRIRYDLIEAQVEWYIRRGVNGIFAVCQSSEMNLLTREERQELCRRVVKAAAGRVPVMASGHVSQTWEEQVLDVETIREAGADAVVLVTNRFAGPDESEEVFLKNLDAFLNRLDPSISLGMYECPVPYKWVLTDRALEYCAKSGRIGFFKDTCCDAAQIRKRIKLAQGTGLRLFNANSATLLPSLQDGADGYSGVMANFHPELYRWLCENYASQPEQAQKVADFLSLASLCECRNYPDCAKYYMGRFLPGMETYSRKLHLEEVPSFIKMEIDSMDRLAEAFRESCGIRI